MFVRVDKIACVLFTFLEFSVGAARDQNTRLGLLVMLPLPSSPEATPRPNAPRMTPDSPARFDGPEPEWLSDPSAEPAAVPEPPSDAVWLRRLAPITDDELAHMPSDDHTVGLFAHDLQIPQTSPERVMPATPRIGTRQGGQFSPSRMPSPVNTLVDKDHPDAYIPVPRRLNAERTDDRRVLDAMPSDTYPGLGIKAADSDSLSTMMRSVKLEARPRRAFGARPPNARSLSVDLGKGALNGTKNAGSKEAGSPLPVEMLDENGAPKVMPRPRSTLSGGAIARDRAPFSVAANMRRRDGNSTPMMRTIR